MGATTIVVGHQLGMRCDRKIPNLVPELIPNSSRTPSLTCSAFFPLFQNHKKSTVFAIFYKKKSRFQPHFFRITRKGGSPVEVRDEVRDEFGMEFGIPGWNSYGKIGEGTWTKF